MSRSFATALRNWRRHFGRAQEVNATLPDGVLLLKALDGPIQQLGALDPQAAFRLAQSRMQLGLDEMPTQQALWSYSQCLLAEAETLVPSSDQLFDFVGTTDTIEVEANAEMTLKRLHDLLQVTTSSSRALRQTSRASTSSQSRAARRANHASGCTPGMALMTSRSGAGYVAEKITESMSAKPALLARSRVILPDQGEETVYGRGGEWK